MNPASGQDGAAGPERDIHFEATAAGSARIFQAGGDQNFHYHGRTRPYLIGSLLAPAPPDTEWLLEQPSRLLGAQSQVVPFVGRQTELRRLEEWRDADGHLSVLLLHGPGGQGKTRLAHEFAERSRSQRWEVLQASTLPTHRGEPSIPEADTAGVLLVVDYADRWALSELEQLLSDPALQQERPTRVLLVGRTVRWFAALRGVLADHRAGAGDLLLTPLDEDRPAMFRAARDRFADLYGLQDASAASAPAVLPDHPDYGLTLTVQMAALVAVDAYRRGAEAPTSPHELSAYLLDREFQAWQRLFEAGAHGQDYQTRPAIMARTVFTAALTGAVDQDCGSQTIKRLDLPGHPQNLLVDHRFCYPPSDRELVLEPLYPDRLAEDFIALFTPGHDISAYDPDPWAKNVPATLLADGEELRPVVVGRAMIFLTSAAERWSHLRGKVLYPLLRSDPALALEAGSATLSSLASIDDLPDDVLAAVQQLLPPGRHVDLDIGAAAIDLASASRILPQTEDPDDEARLRLALSNRLAAAGRTGEALEQSGLAVELGRRLVAADRFGARTLLAGALSNHASDLIAVGRHDDALLYAEEALKFLPNLNSPDAVARAEENALERIFYGASFWGEDLAEVMNSLAIGLDQVGRRADAMAASREALALYEGLSRAGIGRNDGGWACALDNHAARLRQAGKAEEALAMSSQAVELRTALAESDRAGHLPELATSLHNHAIKLAEVGRHAEALEHSERAVALRVELASANRGVYLPDLASATTHHAMRLLHAGLHTEALTAAGQAVEQYEELTATTPAAHLPRLAIALTNYSTCLIEVGRTTEAHACIEQAVSLFEDFSPGDRAANLHAFATTLANHAALLDRLGRPVEAITWSERAVRLREELAVDAQGPAPLLALSNALFKHVHRLSQSGRFADAVTYSEHAVALQEDLAEAPDPHQLQEFAGLLHNYAVSLAESGQPADALAASERALALRKQLSETAANAKVAESLTLHAVRLAAVGEPREAVAESDRAVQMYEELTETDPLTHTPELAVALTNHGNRLAAIERHDEALACTRRACALFEALAEQDRPKYLNQLAVAFQNLVARLVQVGDHTAACPPAERTVELYRELVDDYGSVHLAALVRQLGILASLRLATNDPGSRVPLPTLRSGTVVFDLTRPLRDERQVRSARRAIARLSPLPGDPRSARTQGQAELGLFLLVMNNSPLASADCEEMLTHAHQSVDAFQRAGDTVGVRLALGATVIAMTGRSDRRGVETALARLEVLDPEYARWWWGYTEAMFATDLDQQVDGLRRCVQSAHALGKFADYYTVMCMEKLDRLDGKAGPPAHHFTVDIATVRERTSEE
ncbi:hypothetical protein ACN3XK_74680 [Actinomadura welshii]